MKLRFVDDNNVDGRMREPIVEIRRDDNAGVRKTIALVIVKISQYRLIEINHNKIRFFREKL